MYPVIWSPEAKTNLISLEREMVKRIITKTEEIKYSPYHFLDHLTDVGLWKLRVGDYRVLIEIDEKKKELHVLKIGHRKNIYKSM